jgi:hypothetical protein
MNMRKMMYWVLVAILTFSASVFTACSDNDVNNPPSELTQSTITPEPTTDQLEVMVTADMPMAVLSNFDENSMGGALVKRVSKTTSDIEDDTKFVLFKGNDITSISNEQWLKIFRVYLNGGYIGIERATNREMLAFAVVMGFGIGMVQDEMLEENGVEITSRTSHNEAKSVTSELQRRISNASALTRAAANDDAANDDYVDELDDIGFEMFIMSMDKVFTQVPYNAEEAASATFTDEEGNETITETKVQHLLNAYHYGLLADGAAAFLNQEEKNKAETEAAAETRALTRGGAEQAMNDVLNCSDEFVIRHSLAAIDPMGKIVRRENMGTTTIRSWSVHDFGSHQDFYYIDEKVVIRMGGKNSDYNKTLYWGPYYTDEWFDNRFFSVEDDPKNNNVGFMERSYTNYYGSWLSQIKHSLDLKGKGDIILESSLPATDNSSRSASITVGTSDATSETSGWNVGFSAGYNNASFSFGYSSSTSTTHTNSFSKTIGETSNSLKVMRNTTGTQVTFDYQEGSMIDWIWDPLQHDVAPDILTNDCEVNNMACWRVKNPSDSYQLELSTRHETKCLTVANFVNYKYGNRWTYAKTWNHSYELKQPCRYMGTWNCEIITKGANRQPNATKEFREFLQESVLEAPFKARFNVAERSKGELDVMRNLITNISNQIKVGTRKRRSIDNVARDLGIESFTITWYSDDPDETTEYSISGNIKEE